MRTSLLRVCLLAVVFACAALCAIFPDPPLARLSAIEAAADHTATAKEAPPARCSEAAAPPGQLTVAQLEAAQHATARRCADRLVAAEPVTEPAADPLDIGSGGA
ncbi:hypothetical protein T492DRAFT_863343 [Pavlovales sp. CCMP2436]|nr:hypothetical protein T492DRAFT_863343 [Pavlovales sp. CCMP2436]